MIDLDPHVARARASPFYELVDFIFKKVRVARPVQSEASWYLS